MPTSQTYNRAGNEGSDVSLAMCIHKLIGHRQIFDTRLYNRMKQLN